MCQGRGEPVPPCDRLSEPLAIAGENSKPDASTLLVHVKQNALVFQRYYFERFIQLLSAIASQRMKDISG